MWLVCFSVKEVKTVLFIVWVIFSASDEIKDEDSGPKISSVSGANRKRKWKEEDEEEEKEEEESSDVDTASDDDVEDDEVNKTTEVGEAKEASTPCQKTEDKQKETEEQQKKSEQDGQTQKKISEQNKKLSQPAFFIPVDRSPEIQVGANCMCVWA